MPAPVKPPSKPRTKTSAQVKANSTRSKPPLAHNASTPATSIVDQLAEPSVCDEQLALRLATALHISAPATKKKSPVAVASGRAKSSTTAVRNKPGPSPGGTQGSVGETNAEKQDVAPWERTELAMSAYNAANQSLTAVIQAGWKVSACQAPSTTSKSAKATNSSNGKPSAYSKDQVVSISHSCRVAIRGLRAANDNPKRAVDIEKAAVAFLGKLVAIELYEEALLVMSDVKPALLELYAHEDGSASTAEAEDLHCLPMPQEDHAIDAGLLDAMARFQVHSLTVLSKLPQAATSTPFEQRLDLRGNLLDWYSILNASSFEETRLQAVLNSTGQTVFFVKTSTNSSLLRVRLWVLKCIGLANVVPLDKFWSQVMACCRDYIQGTKNSSSETNTGMATLVCEFFEELTEFFEREPQVKRNNTAAEALFQGSAFLSACDYWMRYAKYLNNAVMIGRIATLIGPSDPLSSGDSASNSKTSAAAMIQLRTVLAAAVVILRGDENVSEDIGRKLDEALQILPQCVRFILAPVDAASSQPRTALIKTMELLCRVCRKNMRIEAYSSTMREHSVGLMEALVEVGEKLLSSDEKEDGILDALFDGVTEGLHALAFDAFEPTKKGRSDPMAANKSFAKLERAKALVVASTTTPSIRARRLQVLSHWYHNCAAKAQSAAFWQRAAELGEDALTLWGSLDMVQTKEEVDGWCTLRDVRIPLRWACLGSALAKSGERKSAHDAYVRVLASSPKSFWDTLVSLSRTESLPSLISQVDSRFTTAMERLTALEAYDLFSFREGEAPLRQALAHSGLGHEAVGIVLEYQIMLLNAVSHKEEAASAIKVLLKELKDVYGTNADVPIRRARIMLRALEMAYSMDETSLAPSPMVVHGLLGSKNLGLDTQLASFIPQYTVSLEVLLSLQAHRHQGLEESTFVILQHSRKALQGLKTMLPSTSPPPKPDKSGSKGTKETSKQAKITGSRTSKTPTKLRAPPKTPKSKGQIATVEVLIDAFNKPASPPKRTSLNLDDPERFYNRLESLANLLGLLGQFLLRMEILESMIGVCEASNLPLKHDMSVWALLASAHEYVKLGKLDCAENLYQRIQSHLTDDGSTSQETRVVSLLRQSEVMSISGDFEQGTSFYIEAMRLSDEIPAPDKHAPTALRVKHRIAMLERSAMACDAYASIQLARDNMTGAISGLTQALRLWNRAIDTASRYRPPSETGASREQGSPNPFRVRSKETPTMVSGEWSIQPGSWDAMLDGVHWRLADGLANTLFSLARLHFMRGSVKPAEYFIQKAVALATSLNAPVLLSRGWARDAEKNFALGQLDPGQQLLQRASYLWEQAPGSVGPDLVDIHRLLGSHSIRLDEPEEAKRIFEVANQLLEELGRHLQSTGSANGMVLTGLTSTPVAPALLASILRQYIWLLRTEVGENPLYNELLDRFVALPASAETRVEQNALMGRLAFEEVQARLNSDLFLSSLPESVMAVPMGMCSGEGVTTPQSTREIQSALATAERFYWDGLGLSNLRGEVHRVREAGITLALIRSLQTALGKGGKNASAITAALIDLSGAITLRREMLEAIDDKLRESSMNDHHAWPSMTVNGSPMPNSLPVAQRMKFVEDSDDDDGDPEANLRMYWQSVKSRYRTETIDAATLAAPQIDSIPDHWTVVSISVTDDENTLLISRQQPHCEPVVFCLPLDRHSRREGEDEEAQFTYAKAIEEFEDIIRVNDETARDAKDITTKEGRAAWWSQRSQLDARLKELVENIEYCWLGAFKVALAPQQILPQETLNVFRQKMEKVFRRNGVLGRDRKGQTNARLDDAILRCFSSLSPKCRDEELEDLIYFMLDLYQLHGVSFALEEVDIDRLVVDLRAMLEEHSTRSKSSAELSEPGDQHLFLVLDKKTQGLPWESIPSLRSRSVSRIPAISFLIDRLELVHHLRKDNGSFASTVDRTAVDPTKTFYVVNPTGDLNTTQKTFEPVFSKYAELGWRGIVGRAPSEEEMLDGLRRSDLVLYFGHGGAEHYVRSHKLRQLPRCAATMLWGCSSGALRDMGDFDRVGTPNHYILAGCPTLVANLWDVTDREIDRIAQAVMSTLRIDEETLKKRAAGQCIPGSPVSVVRAVNESRDKCKLKYLTGAAPIVYGIPFYL